MKHQPTSPTPPPAWLVVANYPADEIEPGHVPRRMVSFVCGSRDDPKLQEAVESVAEAWPVEVVLDDPRLEVAYYFHVIENSSCLSARDNWFARYITLLEPHLANARRTTVFTFERGTLSDPLQTHKSSANGPFPLPRGILWPVCRFCNERLAFLGALDFRQYHDVQVPRGTLVVHVCTKCGVCSDPGAWAVTWIEESDDVVFHGDQSKPVYLGSAWQATDYKTSLSRPEEVVESGLFLNEYAIYTAFTCWADKLGGHVFWIHDYEDETPVDSAGMKMLYIGQLVGTDDVKFGDTGIAYLFYSPGTGETVMYPQWF